MKRRAPNRLRGLRILHEDAEIIVVEKPAGLLAQATRRGDDPSVESVLTDYVRKGQWKSSRHVYLVHRLDRETSGVMMVAKDEATQEWFRSHWNEVTTKVYLAKVEGSFETESGAFESYLREDENYFVKSVKNEKYGKFARTEWRTVKSFEDGFTLVEATLKSGRKNQIRVHFSEAGHPLAGDSKYGRAPRNSMLCLHAWKLSFVHPKTKETLSFEAPPPGWTGLAPREPDDEAGGFGHRVHADLAKRRARRAAETQRPL